MRRQRQRHGIDPMSGQRKNPFDMKEEDGLPGNQILGNHLQGNHRQLRQIRKAKDYLIGFSRHLENNLDGTEFLVGSKVIMFIGVFGQIMCTSLALMARLLPDISCWR